MKKIFLMTLIIMATVSAMGQQWLYVDPTAPHKVLRIPYPMRDSMEIDNVSTLSTPLPWWMVRGLSDSLAKKASRGDSSWLFITPYYFATHTMSIDTVTKIETRSHAAQTYQPIGNYLFRSDSGVVWSTPKNLKDTASALETRKLGKGDSTTYLPRADSGWGYVTPKNLKDTAAAISSRVGSGGGGGSAQLYWLPTLVKPSFSKFSWINQGSATVDTTYGGVYIEHNSTTVDSVSGFVETVDSSTHDVIAAILPQMYYTNYHGVGLFWRNAWTGKMIALEYSTRTTGGTELFVNKWNSPTSWSADYTSATIILGVNSFLWLRIKTTGGTRYCYWSVDGRYWNLFYSVSSTDFISSASQVGFFLNPNNTLSKKIGMFVVHWSVQ